MAAGVWPTLILRLHVDGVGCAPLGHPLGLPSHAIRPGAYLLGGGGMPATATASKTGQAHAMRALAFSIPGKGTVPRCGD